MDNGISIQQLMTTQAITVTPETPLLEAASILVKYNFNGIPVVDDKKKLVGLLTEYDLMIGGSSIHLPTFLKLMKDFNIYSKDKKFIKDDMKKIVTTQVKDAMNAKPFILLDNCTVNDAILMFSEHREVNPIPVVDKDGVLAGIISRYDIVKLFGDSSDKIGENYSERELDKNINKFLDNFENKFVLVTKTRTNYWLFFSLVSVLVGFAIAFFIMVKISLR